MKPQPKRIFESVDDIINDKEAGEALYEMYWQAMPYTTANGDEGTYDEWLTDFYAQNPDQLDDDLEKLNIICIEVLEAKLEEAKELYELQQSAADASRETLEDR